MMPVFLTLPSSPLLSAISIHPAPTADVLRRQSWGVGVAPPRFSGMDRGVAWVRAGASIPPETMMHFPLFQIVPLFWRNFQTLGKIFTILIFSEKFLDFHPPKFLMTFFSNQPQI